MKIDIKSLLVGAFLAAAVALTIGATSPVPGPVGKFQVVAVPGTPQGFVMIDTMNGKIVRYETNLLNGHRWVEVTRNMQVQ